MKIIRFAALLSAVTIASLSAAQYQVVILGPSSGFSFTEGLGCANGQQVGQGQLLPTYAQHAMLWSNSSGSIIDLHPAGYGVISIAYAVGGGQQGGFVSDADGNAHATMWTGSAASAVILDNGLGASDSYVYGVSGGQQAGVVNFPATGAHAALWTGTAASFVDLNPAGANGSVAYGVGGGKQVGTAGIDGFGHPAMWSGSAASFVDMSPTGLLQGGLYGTDGVQQVGWMETSTVPGVRNAILWAGTPNSAIDLRPDGFYDASAFGVANGKQCGYGYGANTGWGYHALVWSGTAASCIDLHQFLPQEFSQSLAWDIAPDGTIVGSASAITGEVAVLWIPTGPPIVFGGFLQPINDPATPESVFKKGSTVPVKFKLTAGGQPVSSAEAHISLTELGAEESPINESYFIMPSDDGTFFRYNDGAGAYVYNLGTKSLVAGRRYRITATWSTGSASVTVSIR